MSEKYEYKKRFYDLEKEENWLNEMSEKGLVLKKIEWGFFADKYLFEPCSEKYVCRIDYNPDVLDVLEEITSPYTMFVTGTYEAEFICCANGKLYFRKAADKGEFPPVYTSLESRIIAEKNQIKRYSLILIIALIYALVFGSMLIDESYEMDFWGGMSISIFFVLLLLMGIMLLKHIFKIRSLKKLSADGGFPPEITREKIGLDDAKNGFRSSVICAVGWLVCMLISAYRFNLRGWQTDLAANITLIAVQGILMIFYLVSAVRFRKKIKKLEDVRNEKGGE